MAQGSRQVQTQAQQQIQTLSPQQILVVKLLELPAVELEDRVRANFWKIRHWKRVRRILPATNTPTLLIRKPERKTVETPAMIL